MSNAVTEQPPPNRIPGASRIYRLVIRVGSARPVYVKDLTIEEAQARFETEMALAKRNNDQRMLTIEEISYRVIRTHV